MSFDPEAVRAFEQSSFDRAALLYDASFGAVTELFVDTLLDAAGVSARMQTLDICCGTGVASASAAARGAVATGLDVSTRMIEVARQRHLAITFDHGDAESLPYRDGSFDAAFSNFGIHHVPRPNRALLEAHRVLRPGARMAFTIWAPRGENIVMTLLLDAIARRGDPSATTAPVLGSDFSTPAHCIAALRQVGFQQVQTNVETVVWRHADAASLVEAMRSGTARMGARLSAQSPGALTAIIADVEAAAASYRDAQGLAMPMAAILAVGTKSAS